MFHTIDPVGYAAIALVTVLVLLRFYYGSALLHIRFARFWGNARSVYMPVVDKLAKRIVGIGAENRAVRIEHVGDVDASPWEVISELQRVTNRQAEVSVLSGWKRDWDGNPEVASIVLYAGAAPFAHAPRWLKNAQYHITLFQSGGLTRITCHFEANSYRPDLWRDHLWKGATFDAERGREACRQWVVASDLPPVVSVTA